MEVKNIWQKNRWWNTSMNRLNLKWKCKGFKKKWCIGKICSMKRLAKTEKLLKPMEWSMITVKGNQRTS